MTDKVISMKDFLKTKEQLETNTPAPEQLDITLDYDDLMFAAWVLENLAETGEININNLIQAYGTVAEILMGVAEDLDLDLGDEGLEIELEGETYDN